MRLIATILVGASLFSGAASAASETTLKTSKEDAVFPRPAQLEGAVSFWRKIFAEYSENQVVIHSMDYPNKIYGVLDYRDDVARGVDKATIRARAREDEKAARGKIERLLKIVQANRKTPQKLDPEARKVYELFADIDDPNVYKDQLDRVRSQRGLRERTGNAMAISGRYLPNMEAVFKSYQLPVGLTRLPLVESSFNVDAYSKVGAAGIWQFMPSSARIYMRLDEVVDDRRDPWFATDGAARHLRDDYALLQQWPLAVTAYNYGRVGLARALKTVDGSTLEDLLDDFDGRRFGFASRNFYAEFLAALDVARNRDHYYKDVEPEDRLDFDVITTANYVPYETLRELASIDEASFRRLNPAYQDEVVAGKLYIPPHHEVRVPAGLGKTFKLAYAGLGQGRVFDRQRVYWIQHRVARGETLGGIAHRYGSSIRDIQQANGISNPRLIRIGQTIKVPPRDSGGVVIAAAAPGLQSTVLQHRIASGDTLGAIARRYGSSVSDIQRANGISDPRLIRIGQTIKVPASGASAQAAVMTHRVRSGDTLGGIADRYDTTVSALQAINGISDPRSLRSGEVIRLQAGTADGGLQELAYSKTSSEPAYRLHRVESGQTLSAISRRYGISSARLSSYNGLTDPDQVRAGTLLKVPER
ncbi:MAG: LysM peptidoglycan-binding domain-containing protein [Pseudomonadota bacterium]|nr:LysM peptidoglycan-binding domain-containing protein [Pseudomonadota bacterium]